MITALNLSLKHILIVEDHADTMAWLQSILQTAFPGVEISETVSVEMAIRLSGRQFDLCIVDLSLPDGSGVEVIRHYNQQSKNTLCVVATIHDDSSHVFSAMKAGAAGYLLKDQDSIEFVNQLRGILDGKPPLSPVIARQLLTYFHQFDTDPVDIHLTPRETEVLQLIGKGLQRAEIARLLCLSQHTISGYIKTTYKKLNIRSSAEAAVEAMRRGLL